MMFRVLFHPEFIAEWKALDVRLKELTGEILDMLEDEGPMLGRPSVDTLQGSRHANMKEMRVRFAGHVWRFAFAFDPKQRAIVLCGGENKARRTRASSTRHSSPRLTGGLMHG